MTWRVARSLDQLLTQLNTLAPNRSRLSDGSIGDAAHQADGDASDHNPWFVLANQPLVTARDFTHDPAGGLDCNKLAAALIAAKDPRVKYLIWQGQLMDSRAVAGNGYRPWTWQPSSGHDKHLHLSVMDNASADDPRPWSLPGLAEPQGKFGGEDMLIKKLTGAGAGTVALVSGGIVSAVDPKWAEETNVKAGGGLLIGVSEPVWNDLVRKSTALESTPKLLAEVLAELKQARA